jgi:hypothetical protein
MIDNDAVIGVMAARRRAARLWQFPLIDRSWPAIAPTSLESVTADTEVDLTDVETVQEPLEQPKYLRGKPVKGDVPVQAAVDRTEFLAPTLVDLKVRLKNGTVILIIKKPIFGNFGSDPMDPCRWAPGVDPRTAICGALAPYAAARCMAGRGYF